jgi:hypothetical protein
MATGIRNDHVTAMGFSVRLRETRHGFVITVGGRQITKRNGEPMTYAGLQKAVDRFNREVAAVEGVEARVKQAGAWHPVRLCAGGCGLEMRVTDRRYPDGRVDTAEAILARGERAWCVSCSFHPQTSAA